MHGMISFLLFVGVIGGFIGGFVYERHQEHNEHICAYWMLFLALSLWAWQVIQQGI